MAITTSVAKHFRIRMHIMGILCVVFGVWGAYDYFVVIPRQQALYEEHRELSNQEFRSEAEHDRLMAIEEAAGGTPEPPGTFNKLTQIFFMLCLPCAPYFWWQISKVKRRVYTLDDDGTLHLPETTLSTEETADIDMSRWMAKSIAHVEDQSGERYKLDAYLHKDLDLIVGKLAHRLYPEQWTEEAKPVKDEEAETDLSAHADEATEDEIVDDPGDRTASAESSTDDDRVSSSSRST